MPTAGEVILEVLPSTKAFGAALSAEMKPALAKAESTATQSTSRLGGAFSRMGTVAKAGLAAAGFAAISFGKSSVNAFLESETAMAELNHAVELSPQLTESATQAFADQASALQELTGFQDELILNADTILSRFGLTQQQIESAIPAVLDFARATGRDVPDAASAVGKALLGNARALKDVGVDFTATGDRARDFNSILGILQQQVGGTAKAFGQTTAGQLEIAKARFDEVQEAIGGALVPALTTLLEAVQPIIGVLAKLAPLLPEIAAGFVGIKLAMTGLKLLDAASAATGFGAAIKGATGSLLLFAPALAAASLGLPVLLKSFESAKDTAARFDIPTDWIERANSEWAFFTTHFRGNLREMFSSSIEDVRKWGEANGFTIQEVNKAISGNIDKLGGWSGGFDQFEESARGTLQTMHPLGEAIGRATAEFEAQQSATDGAAAAADRAAFAAEGLAESQAKAALEARNLYTAQLSLAGGLLGLEGNAMSAADAQQTLADANAEVTKLQKSGKQGTQAYSDALEAQDRAALEATNSQLSLVSSVQDYVAENQGSKASTAEAISLIRQYGRDAGLTGSQINGLIGDVAGLVQKYGTVPDSVVTDLVLHSGDSMASIQAYWERLKDIPSHIDTTVTVHYEQTGNPTTKGPAV